MPRTERQPTTWLRAFWQRAYRENVTGLAAMVAYNLMLAVFPFVLLVLFITVVLNESMQLIETHARSRLSLSPSSLSPQTLGPGS